MLQSTFHRLLAVAALFASVCFAHSGLAADEWGTIKGVFKYDGVPPKPKPIAADKDAEFCGKHGLVNESLVVDPATKGIRDIVIYLYTKPTEKAPPIHPDALAAAKEKVVLSNINCRFEPRIVGAMIDQPVVLGNADPVGHNVKVNSLNNSPINPIIPAKSEIDHVFKKKETLPTQVQCSIHPWMAGYIVVKDHPYIAVTGPDGSFEIKNVPAGKWTYQFWHETGFVDKVKIKGKDPKWSKGRTEIKIEPGKTYDLGEVLVAPSVFK